MRCATNPRPGAIDGGHARRNLQIRTIVRPAHGPRLHHGAVRDDLPTGRVTFLFTDVEGSTRLLDELGPEGYALALDEHRAIVRSAFADHGGVEVDSQGDAFFYAFADPNHGLAGAAEAQVGLAGGPIRVRMGLHTGEATLTAGGYVGRDVHYAARIAAAGFGGQVLISGTTRAAVGDSFELTDLGEHRLKDFSTPTWIYQLGNERFPPLKTISNTNLPRPASTFVGRERELREVVALLREGARLLTLTGPGGTGKTRLSLEAAAELVPEFRNGVFWVGLAALRDAGLVAESIGRSIGARDGLAEHIGEREMLLVLDNLEQVIEAAPALADLVEHCPHLRVLTTSRERLRVRGETHYSVPSLEEVDAVALFVARSGLSADVTIVDLCRRLDGLPLAIELAAARTSVLTPAQIRDRLSTRLDLLRGGRDAEARQQTLRAAIEWSHDLLSERERVLFRRLSVFRGGWTLEAAEEVAEADLEDLASLADKSLIRRRDERFMMLETIREFAAEQVARAGEAAERGRRHTAYFAALVEQAEPHLQADDIEWLDRLETDIDNLRAALDQLGSAGDPQKLLALAGRLQRFWYLKSHLAEGRQRLESALSRDNSPTATRAKALRGASVMALNVGDPEAARSYAEQALAIDRELGDAWGEAYSLMMIGNSLGEANDVKAGRPFLEQAMARFEALGDKHYELIALSNAAWMTEEIDGPAAARRLHEASLVRARALGNERMAAGALEQLAFYARDEGRLDEAVSMFRQALAIVYARGQLLDVAINFGRLASALVRKKDPVAAAQLLSASEALLESLGHARAWWDVRRNQETVALIEGQLSAADDAAATEQGRRMSVEQAVALAMGSSSSTRHDQPRSVSGT